MNRSVAEAAKVLGAERDLVKRWSRIFQEYLSSGANPASNISRQFTDNDMLVLCYACTYWEGEPDLEAIKMGLNTDSHLEDRFREHLYLHTPLLQEPPDDLDETWRHGVLMCGGAGRYEALELARNYRWVAESALQSALESDDADGAAYPVLFTYRHTLELYLKIIGQVDANTHSLEECVRAVEKRFGRKIGAPIRGWILELDHIDPRGTAFRYANVPLSPQQQIEHWFDFVHFKFAMKRVFDLIDMAILNMSKSVSGEHDGQ